MRKWWDHMGEDAGSRVFTHVKLTYESLLSQFYICGNVLMITVLQSMYAYVYKKIEHYSVVR